MVKKISVGQKYLVIFRRTRLKNTTRTSQRSGENEVIQRINSQALTYQMLLPLGLALGCTAWLVSIVGLGSNEISQRAVMPVGLCSETATRNDLSTDSRMVQKEFFPVEQFVRSFLSAD